MPTVETSVIVHAPLDVVYAVAKDNRSFPLFMPDVKSLSVVEEDGPRVVSDWIGVISAFNVKVRWKQEDVWDDAAHVCAFRQLEGDYDMMDGTWTFTEVGDGVTKFDSILNYEYEVPALGPLVRRVVHSLVIKNMDSVLAALKKRSEEKVESTF
ncbi:MAG: SRPBCC family protein [Chthonomonas sp.]|nr:SRPBCC family protein [Chthonomonas sp.]